jgi:hypothetical protein
VAATLDPSTIDLLGVLAYGELTAFERLASDAQYAPTVADKAALGAMAVAEYGHFRRLREHLAAAGADPEEAMAPFVASLDAFHAATAPNDWLEGLIKAYIGEGLATDFYREVAGLVHDEDARALVLEVLADTGQAEFTVARVRAAIAADPGSAAGSRCGAGGWSARRSSRRSGWRSSATRSPSCSSAPATSPASRGCCRS